MKGWAIFLIVFFSIWLFTACFLIGYSVQLVGPVCFLISSYSYSQYRFSYKQGWNIMGTLFQLTNQNFGHQVVIL